MGRHLLAEYWGCEPAMLDNVELVEHLLKRAAIDSGAHIVQSVFHRFSPQGVSGVVVIEESHLSVHTWPEARYAAVDFYTCGEVDPRLAHEILSAGFHARSGEMMMVHRGLGVPMSTQRRSWPEGLRQSTETLMPHPSRFFMVSGSSDGPSPLNAFDQALLASGIGDTNLVRMSSILPPRVERMEPCQLPYGALVPVAYAEMTSGIPGQLISAAVAIAIPTDPELPGLIMEHHGVGPAEETKAIVMAMAEAGMGHRRRAIKEILVEGAECVVDHNGCAFAGVVLWHEDDRLAALQ